MAGGRQEPKAWCGKAWGALGTGRLRKASDSERLMFLSSLPGFHNADAFDIWGWIILCCGGKAVLCILDV